MDRVTDATAVHTVMTEYAEATRARSVERLSALFHPQAVMTGYLGPDLLVGGPGPFYDALAANEVSPAYRGMVLSVSVTGDTARAVVAEQNLFGMAFVNDFHLVRTADGWRIVSKLFHAEPEV